MFGSIIKSLRLRDGLTQEELGKKLNKTKNNISQYENEKREPDFGTLLKLSEIFSVPMSYLFGIVDPEDKAREILNIIEKAGINIENIDYDKLEQLLKLANIEKDK